METVVKDEQLRSLLRSLPGKSASAEFTSRVLSRLERPPETGGWWSQPALIGLTAVGVLLLAAGALLLVAPDRLAPGAHADLSATRVRVEKLRSEYETLEEELQELRLLSAESQPLLGVRGDDGREYLVDLRQLASPPGGAQPTSYSFDY